MDSVDLQVLRSSVAWLGQGHRVILATIVETWGSSPRPAGAMLAIRGDGLVAGSVSGGCVEDDLIFRIRDKSLAVEKPEIATYGISKDEATRYGLPCGGKLELVLEPIRDKDSVVELLNRGVAPQSIFDALFDGAGELLMRAPGILSLHATTCTNAMHYSWQHCHNEETRRLLLLQNAAYLPLFRGKNKDAGARIDELEPMALNSTGPGAIEEIFAEISKNRLSASRKIIGFLNDNPDPKPLADAARRLIFLKGRDAHDYKFSTAVLEDYHHLAPPWRDRFLAASVFYLKGSGAPDNELVKRTRAALT